MLGDRLKELRLNNGLKQSDLLKKFNLSSARYSKFENDKSVFSKIEKLNVNDIVQFRKIVSIAYENDYNIYQLTRL